MLARFSRTFIVAVLFTTAASFASQPVLFSGWRTPEEAATAVLEALAANDETTLLGYCVTAGEYRRHVWPELPASHTRSKHLLDLIWSRHDIRNRQSIPRRLGEYGGRHFTLLAITYREEKLTYPHIRIIPVKSLRVKEESGVIREIRPLGTLYYRDGRYQVFSYYFD